MMLFFLGVLSSSWASGVCGDPVLLVDHARQALLEARIEDSIELMDRAHTALGCAGVPTADALAGMWLTYGAQRYFTEDKPGAVLAFAAAHRVSPTMWYPELGFELRTVYERASTTDHGQGTLLVQNLAPELSGVLNGVPVTFPQDVVAGPQLVQFLERDLVREARVVTVPAREAFLIDASLLEPSQPPDAVTSATVPAASTGRRWGFLVAGGVSALAAGGTYLLARQQSDVMDTALSTATLDEALGRQRVYAGATYGLSGVALAGVGLYIAL